MATRQYVATSNAPGINPNYASSVRKLLTDYNLGVGSFGTITSEIDTAGDQPTLHIYGQAPFEPVSLAEVRNYVVRTHDVESNDELERLVAEHKPDFRAIDAENFLSDLSSYLAETLMVQTIGHTKCRFPVTAYQNIVTPSGNVQHERLQATPKKQ